MVSPTQEQIAKALKRKKVSLRAWSEARGYKYNTVFNTTKRWAGRNDRTPHGGIARLIMRDLSEFVAKAD